MGLSRDFCLDTVTILYYLEIMAKKKRFPRDVLLQVRLTAEEKTLFEEASEKRHLSVSAWIRLAGLDAAKRERRTTS